MYFYLSIYIFIYSSIQENMMNLFVSLNNNRDLTVSDRLTKSENEKKTFYIIMYRVAVISFWNYVTIFESI